MQRGTVTFDQVSVRARDPKGFEVAHACARQMLVEGGVNYILGVERPGEDMATEVLKNAVNKRLELMDAGFVVRFSLFTE